MNIFFLYLFAGLTKGLDELEVRNMIIKQFFAINATLKLSIT